jgi:lipopolysaccharide export system protein LptA
LRPGVAPAIAPKAVAATASDKSKSKPLAAVSQAAQAGEIHVKTSGLIFDQKNGTASTDKHVDFSMAQGAGSSMGATYDSEQGHLVLDNAVELTTQRGGESVTIHAQHAEFERESQVCHMRAATADFRGSKTTAGEANILFRPDGSTVSLDALNGFTLTTANGSHVAAPTGRMEFDEHNQPRHGHMQGGVTMDSATQTGDRSRKVHGSSPTAELEFTPKGELRQVHLERGVEMHSQELSESVAGPVHVNRTWRSPLADIAFRKGSHGQTEPAIMHGIQGVVVTGETQRGQGPVAPSRFAADDVTGVFGADSTLSSMTGVGHAGMEETTATGTRQTSSGDRLEAHFGAPGSGAAQIEWAVLDGHVVLAQEAAAKAGAPPPAAMRATAGRATYEGAGEWLHLTVNPRVEDGGLQLTADKVDVSRDSGDAFAHGNVKATWLGSAKAGSQTKPAGAQGSIALGGQGPAHVISAEAQMRQATGEATFRGHARLWQQANSVSAPTIVLDRLKQTLVARSTDPAEPVRAVLVSVAATAPAKPAGQGTAGKPSSPSVIRMHGGDLKYSDAERKAVMHGGALGTVVAETGTATSISDQVELILLPAGNHAGPDGGSAQVDRMTARGHVAVSSEGRRGTGEQLVYTGENTEYVLTGTASAPPRFADPARGSVTGEALIFNSRDDSVRVEGGTHRTTTETTAPR